ncbi:MAG: class I SAM-dependent methyltransferase, partial [Acidobacteriota bacterium]
LAGDGRAPAERERLVTLMELLADLPAPPDPLALFPRYEMLRRHLIHEIESGTDEDALEQAFLELYCHLHGHEAPYTATERRRVDQTGGYWAHAGGLAPVLKAPDWITPATRSADFGAGNGLQLLLVQRLAPHATTVQIEISSAMCEVGRELQHWLGVPRERVEWRCADVTTESPTGYDFIYLYRPVRPAGAGAAFYQRFAGELRLGAPDEVVVFSIADCLDDYRGSAVERFYFDGHLACFRRSAIVGAGRV